MKPTSLSFTALAAAILLPCLAPARTLELDLAIDRPQVLAGRPQTAFLRVALEGVPLEEAERTPVNLAIVIDRSGSMAGDKLREAKEAAIMAVDLLRGDDVVSVVSYDDVVQVHVPATPLDDREAIRRAIRRLRPGGSTALFAGVAKGAYEVRKYLAENRVNRVVLLSDGLANQGPSTPGELGELGASLATDGMSVTTIGLGLDYNESLMTRLATASDGNHYFAETAADLERVYARELDDVLSVVAQSVRVEIRCPRSVRPVRTLGLDAEIRGRTVRFDVRQIYGGQLKYVLVEVEVPSAEAGASLELARVDVVYDDMRSRRRETIRERASISFTDSFDLVERNRDSRVMGSVARQLGAERNRVAMELRDRGETEEARRLLEENAAYLRENAERWDNRWLEQDARRNEEDADNLDPASWKRQRKAMEYNQFEALQSLGYVE